MSTIARVATICQDRMFGETPEQARELIIRRLADAMLVQPDLLCLPETFTSPRPSLPIQKIAEPVPGPTTDAAAAIARLNRSYVICPILTRRDGLIYNSAVLIGRSGEIIGIYDKRRPVTTKHDYSELESGVTPGTGEGVFDLDFGRIGIRICFDIGFKEDWQLLADRDVVLTVWPSAYNGGFPLQAYAALHEMYVVSSVRTDSARIIDPCGTIVERTEPGKRLIYRDINLDFLICHTDFNYGIPARIKNAYGDRVSVIRDDDTGSLLIEGREDGITSVSLMKEFGIEPRRKYFARHRFAINEITKGKTLPKQLAAHGERPMYSA